MTDDNAGKLAKTISMEDLEMAMVSIGASNTAVPSVDELYETAQSKDYVGWTMPVISSALLAQKVDANGPGVTWSVPGDYKKNVELYVNDGGRPQKIIPTDLYGIVVGGEMRPSRRGNEGETATLSVVGVCNKDTGKCLRQLPNINTGLVDTIYEYSESEDGRNTKPSKPLASLKWQPVTPEGLLVDLIRDGRSTATVVDKKGKESVAVVENRGMCYMWVTYVAVRTQLATDADGGPKITKMQNREEVMANLITTKRRVNKKVHTSYSFIRLYHMSELMDEEGNPMQPMFLALNMSNSAMKSHYNGGLASFYRYIRAIMDCKGLKAPADRTLSEDEAKVLRAMNESGFYRNPFAWTTMMALGDKDVKEGTRYSMPHFEGFGPTGNSLSEGREHDDWGDSRGIGSLNVTYLAPNLRERLRFDPTTAATVVNQWNKLLEEAGFTPPEEFYLDELVSIPKDYTDVPYTPVTSTATVVSPGMKDYFPEEVDDEDNAYD